MIGGREAVMRIKVEKLNVPLEIVYAASFTVGALMLVMLIGLALAAFPVGGKLLLGILVMSLLLHKMCIELRKLNRLKAEATERDSAKG